MKTKRNLMILAAISVFALTGAALSIDADEMNNRSSAKAIAEDAERWAALEAVFDPHPPLERLASWQCDSDPTVAPAIGGDGCTRYIR